jgi:hypothetical protein
MTDATPRETHFRRGLLQLALPIAAAMAAGLVGVGASSAQT